MGQTNETMEDLTKSNQKEAIAMRIITVVTLLYLPATFVSVGEQAKAKKNILLTFSDLLQHRRRQISRSGVDLSW